MFMVYIYGKLVIQLQKLLIGNSVLHGLSY